MCVCHCETVHSRIRVFGEWGGLCGSATALTDFQAPQQNHKPCFPLLLTPAEASARFNTASTKQTQTPTVLLYVACSGCARHLVEDTCLYHNHNTVDLQRETPAHARTTQNITDHLLNIEIEPRCNVKVGASEVWPSLKKISSNFEIHIEILKCDTFVR